MENKSAILLNNVNNNLKEHDRAVLGATTKGRMKGPWNHIYTASAPYATADSSGFTNLSGFSWPPRLYVCSFCKREFRSAQALGGHMNVHRRDRARLRQSPPSSPPMELVAGNYCPTVPDSINLNLIPNPSSYLTQSSWMIQKPNSNTTATCIINSTEVPSFKSSCPFIISSSSESSASGTKRWPLARLTPTTTSTTTKSPNPIDASNYTEHYNNLQKAWENGGLLRLGFGTSSGLGKEDLDLDLELRLGYPS